ncbi:MAG: hypothetical protein V8T45_08840 [Oscillospiraceae bacterium]
MAQITAKIWQAVWEHRKAMNCLAASMFSPPADIQACSKKMLTVTVSALRHGGQGGHVPLEALGSGSLGRTQPLSKGPLNSEQSLVVQHQLLVIG